MFLISFAFIFLVSLAETFNMKTISMIRVKYFSLSVISFIGATISLLIFLYSYFFLDANFNAIYDYRLYIAALLEVLGISIALKNFQHNGNNLKLINFSLILSLILVPIFSYIGFKINFFEGNITFNYDSPLDFIIFISILCLLIGLFFIDKVKEKQINKPLLFCLYPLALSATMYFATSLIQIYDGFLVYSFNIFCVSFTFFIISFLKKELKTINRDDLKQIRLISLIWVIAVPLNIIAIKLVAVELITTFKRISQIIVGILLDLHYKHKHKFSKKDFFIIGIIFIFVLSYV